MTTTHDAARPLPPIGQVVGLAQASLTRLLNEITRRARGIPARQTITEGN